MGQVETARCLSIYTDEIAEWRGDMLIDSGQVSNSDKAVMNTDAEIDGPTALKEPQVTGKSTVTLRLSISIDIDGPYGWS